MNRLRGMRTYLAGSMDRVADGGVQWREWITPKLYDLGVSVINPCDKPIDVGCENIEDRAYRYKLIANGNYDELAKQMKIVRNVDLRCTDMADFLVVNFNTNEYMCGTFEEIFNANRQKKPILLYCPQGKHNMHHWIFGVIPHQFMFDTWNQLFEYLHSISDGSNQEHLRRWLFFDYEKILPPQLRVAHD